MEPRDVRAATIAALEALEAWCQHEVALLGAVDGYDYRSTSEPSPLPNRSVYAMTTEAVATDAEKLGPCPFCGGNGRLYQRQNAAALWRVACENCDAGPSSDIGKDAAIKTWNTRPAPRPADAGVREEEDDVERVALAIEATMFAPHELPLDAELHAKYRVTALAAISAMSASPTASVERAKVVEECIRMVENFYLTIPEEKEMLRANNKAVGEKIAAAIRAALTASVPTEAGEPDEEEVARKLLDDFEIRRRMPLPSTDRGGK
jgi:hypothetical protein